MTTQTRVGGFKVLRDVVWIPLSKSGEDKGFPAEFCHSMAEQGINLPFITYTNHDKSIGFNVVVDASNSSKASSLVERNFCEVSYHTAKAAILSIFPHNSNPEIIGTIFEVFGRAGLDPKALAHSNSAVSVVLPEDDIAKATRALFVPFSFSAYRTPEDWKLTQKNKEKLYREVVASYQERKPKVYALEWLDGQELFELRLDANNLGTVGTHFKTLSRSRLTLTFLSTCPSTKKGSNLFFCLPRSGIYEHTQITGESSLGNITHSPSPVSIFSMNGPHFGDRYGIVSELLTAFNIYHIELLALSCTVASITGILPTDQVQPATEAIRTRFDVPSVIRRNCQPPQ